MSSMLPSEMACASVLLDLGQGSSRPQVKTSEDDAGKANEEEKNPSPPLDVDGRAANASILDLFAPDEIVREPGPHDVLCGRGGGTNNHAGNIKFRLLVNDHKLRYLAACKADKPRVAAEVVRSWRRQDPPGRFLSRLDPTRTGPGCIKHKGTVWYDVGNKKAKEKASQCLRERTPDVIPFVREIQRQQDLLTGQGLLYMEQHQLNNDQDDTPAPPTNAALPPLSKRQLLPTEETAQPPTISSLPVPSSLEVAQTEALLFGRIAPTGFNANLPHELSYSAIGHPTYAPHAAMQLYPSQRDIAQAQETDAFLMEQYRRANGLSYNSAPPTNPFNLTHLAALSSGSRNMHNNGIQTSHSAHDFPFSNKNDAEIQDGGKVTNSSTGQKRPATPPEKTAPAPAKASKRRALPLRTHKQEKNSAS